MACSKCNRDLMLGPAGTPCNSPRLQILATPTKRRILALWLEYAKKFPPEKADGIKLLLQELYSLTPEDTETYFQVLRKEAHRRTVKRRVRAMLHKKYKKLLYRKQSDCAYTVFENILIYALRYAFYHQLPPLMSVRLKNLSDVILEQLCELREVCVPKRTSEDKLEVFLLSVADWMAICMQHVLYRVYYQKNLEMDALEKAQAEKRQRELEEEMERQRKLAEAEDEGAVISTVITIEDLDVAE